MESCRNVSVSGGFFPPEQLQKLDVSHGAAGFDDFFPGETEEESDVGLEWLSVFIEDSFSSNGITIPPPTNFQSSVPKASETHQKPFEQEQNLQASVLGPSESHQKSCEREEVSGTCKTRATKRKRTRTISTLLGSGESYRHMQNLITSDSPESPLLPQTYWLADSELIAPKKAQEEGEDAAHLITETVPIIPKKEVKEGEENEERGRCNGSKRCSHCLSQQTPQWRAGPMGPKTLCNACGVRFKSGRLFPEYRPAKSPTYVEYKHSNSHKIVMKMRMMANVT